LQNTEEITDPSNEKSQLTVK